MHQKNQLAQTSPPSWLSPCDLACSALAIISGLAIGWLDLQTTEVLVTILALLSVGSLLGMLQPTAAWRWAALVAIGLPTMAAAARLSGLHTAEPARLDFGIMLVALGFALLGSYAGALIGRALRVLTGRSS